MAISVIKKNCSSLTTAARRYIPTSFHAFSSATAASSTLPEKNSLPPKKRTKVASSPKHPGPSTPLSKLGQSRASRYAEAAALRAAADSNEDMREQMKKPKKEKSKKKEAPKLEPITVSQSAHSDLPFAFRYSYTEIPKVEPIAYRAKYSPFGPGRLDRPWDGEEAPPVETSSARGKQKVEKKKHVIDSFNPPTKKGMKPIAPPGPFLPGNGPKKAKTRVEILGEPLTKEETDMLVRESMRSQKQLNMGRDGLTHNLVICFYDYWTRERMVRVKCMGVATVDMDNMVYQIEDKTGGRVIHRAGGTLHVFRGRYYNNKNRPNIPRMLWRPHSPIYPKLVTEAFEGLSRQAANALRKRGRELLPLCRLAKNGFYGDLVENIREEFEEEELVRIDCKAVDRRDYKKIGAKLRDLVPCVLVSFQEDQILLWKGKKHSRKVKREPSLVENMDTTHGKSSKLGRLDVHKEVSTALGHDDEEDARRSQSISDEGSSAAEQSVDAVNCYKSDNEYNSSDDETEDTSHLIETFDDEDESCHEETKELMHQNGVNASEEEIEDASLGYETADEVDGPRKSFDLEAGFIDSVGTRFKG